MPPAPFRAAADRRYIARIREQERHSSSTKPPRAACSWCRPSKPARPTARRGRPRTVPWSRGWRARRHRPTPRPERYLDERARHALHVLAPRDKAVARWLDRRFWRPGWTLLALLLGAVLGAGGGRAGRQPAHQPAGAAGVGGDRLEPARLPEPAAAGVAPQRARAWLARRLARAPGGSAPLQACGQAWARHGWPLAVARAALLLHLAAAALAARAGGRAVSARPGARLPRRLAEHLPRRRHRAGACSPRCWRRRWRSPASRVPDAAALEALRVGPRRGGQRPAPRRGSTCTRRCWRCSWCCRGWRWRCGRRRVRAGWRATWRCRRTIRISSACCANTAAARRACRCCRTAPHPRRRRRWACARCWRRCSARDCS